MRNWISGKNKWLLFIDVLCFVLVDFMYFIIEKTSHVGSIEHGTTVFIISSAVIVLMISLFRIVFHVYSIIWRYSGTESNLRLVIADMCGGIASISICWLIYRLVPNVGFVSFWYFVIVISLTALMSLSARFCYRLLYKKMHSVSNRSATKINIAIVGAGQLGLYLAEDLCRESTAHYNPVCFIDTNREKIGGRIRGLPVCSEKDIADIIEKYEIKEAVIAISDIVGEELSRLKELYESYGCKIKIYSNPMGNTDGGDVSDSKKTMVIREFQIEDLLFRKPLEINNGKALAYYSGKTVLITGGGGSIGSEICRQIIKCSPKKLIVFDIYENNAYEIQQELKLKYGRDLDLEVEIGSVRDRARLNYIFDKYRPDIVFHAAAHKHVPLMENSSCEAIKNNVIGTFNTADMAEKYGVKKFILISTDKAVNPTNVMGASKRLCEMVIQCRRDSNTCFAAVRFGNVLGSNGSVIPLFKRQIASGGPITITDKRIIRYFMTISEASQLVIQAGAMAEKGQLFVLDMGKPIRIYDLAVNMIKLSGFKPDIDIKIDEIGLRPGEKLYEELLISSETLSKTENDLIFIENDTPLTREEVNGKLEVLRSALEDFEHNAMQNAVKDAMMQVVPTYSTPENVNERADKSMEMKLASADKEKTEVASVQ